MTLENAALALIVLLLGGNAYFIKRLVDKVETSAEVAKSAKTTVDSVLNQLREIKSKIEDLRRIEIDVAVLKSAFSAPRRKKKPNAEDEESTENGA